MLKYKYGKCTKNILRKYYAYVLYMPTTFMQIHPNHTNTNIQTYHIRIPILKSPKWTSAFNNTRHVECPTSCSQDAWCSKWPRRLAPKGMAPDYDKSLGVAIVVTSSIQRPQRTRYRLPNPWEGYHHINWCRIVSNSAKIWYVMNCNDVINLSGYN